jgi:hypothetical protein
MTYTKNEFTHARNQVQLFFEDRHYLGSFKSALIDAIFHADTDNLDKLYLGFPALVDAVRLYQTGELHKVVMVQHANGTQEKDPGFK